MATYAIGDIHGCFKTFMALLAKLNVTDEDTLILCGDLVDRGPAIKEVLDFVFARKAAHPERTRIIYGNHCFHWVDYFADHDGPVRNAWMWAQGLKETILQLGVDGGAQKYARHFATVAEYVVKDVSDKYVFCHADYNWKPGEEWHLEHMWVRMTKSTHAAYDGPAIVHGHTPCAPAEIYHHNAKGDIVGINLDGGCVYKTFPWGSCLRALNVDTGEIIEQQWCEVQ